jgi:hypothetical protein
VKEFSVEVRIIQTYEVTLQARNEEAAEAKTYKLAEDGKLKAIPFEELSKSSFYCEEPDTEVEVVSVEET